MHCGALAPSGHALYRPRADHLLVQTLTICELEIVTAQGGKLTIPSALTADTTTIPMQPIPIYLSTCFIPAGAIIGLMEDATKPLALPLNPLNPNPKP